MVENNQMEQPRFHPKTDVPIAPEGKVVVKFYGEPAIISARQPEDELFGGSVFTERQLAELTQMAAVRAEITRLANGIEAPTGEDAI